MAVSAFSTTFAPQPRQPRLVPMASGFLVRRAGSLAARAGCSGACWRHGRRAAAGWLVLVLLLAGCASSSRQKTPAWQPPATVSTAVTLAEPSGDPEVELEALERHHTPPAVLRKAFLALRLGHPQRALELTAAVLYGETRPAANEESFARYLRAEAYTALGTPELGRFDLDRARSLAMEPALLQRLPAPAAPAANSSPTLGKVTVHRRADWQARQPTKRLLDPMQRVTRLTIHHSAVYFRDTRQTTSVAQIQRIQRDHMQSSGWADIGYHFLIDPAGRVWEGRELRYQGAHAEGHNNIGNIGICVLGNFMRGRDGQQPTPAQVAAMRQLVADLMQRYRFGADSIYCHRDFKATDCPGPLLQPVVHQLARELSREVGQQTGAAGPGRAAGASL